MNTIKLFEIKRNNESSKIVLLNEPVVSFTYPTTLRFGKKLQN